MADGTQRTDGGRSAGALRRPVVVLVGASAGGLEPLKEFISALPTDAPLAVVVIQHAQAGKETYLPEILGRLTPLRVVAATNGAQLAAGVVSVIPPGSKAAIADDRILLEDRGEAAGAPHLIDALFSSAAEALGPRAACVVMSGSGNDGTRGVKAIRSHGGLVLVQAPQEAAFDSMPRSAVSTGLADHVVAARLMQGLLVDHARMLATRSAAGSVTDDADVRRVLELLYERTGNDFREYRSGTVRRRLSRRMALVGAGTVDEYVALLQSGSEEPEELTKDLLIGVTGFFRDPQAFEELAIACIRPSLETRELKTPVRAWVPGCATGEEAYSIAMLLHEEAERAGAKRGVTVFASDLDEESLAVARAGFYSAESVSAISQERLTRFFEPAGDSWRVGEELRRSLVFACHNFVSDPPFSKLDLVSCRNLLIYLEQGLQKKAHSIFGFALNCGGYLFLGMSDADAAQSEWFDAVNGRLRIYRRNDVRARAQEASFSGLGRQAFAGLDRPRDRTGVEGLDELAREALLEHFGAAVLIAEREGGIRYFYGSASRFLGLPSGAPDLNVFTMLPETVAARLRAAAHQAAQDDRPVTFRGAEMDGPGGHATAQITVAPVGGGDEYAHLAVILEEIPVEGDRPASEGDLVTDGDRVVERLERELREARDGLRATVRDYERTTEELHVAHEEVISMNEELQSTNEELETSKEEIQSANEELNTINAELRERVAELGEANNDLSNLVGATSIATLFLDRDLCIKRFTPPAAALLNLVPGDQGRPIGHFKQTFDGDELAVDARRVLDALTPLGREVCAEDGKWYTLYVMPYRTLSDSIDGVVVTLADVTRLKQAEEAAQLARVYAEAIIDATREPLVVLDATCRLVSANRAFAEMFGIQKDLEAGSHLDDVADGALSTPDLDALVARVISGDGEAGSCEIAVERAGPGPRTYLANANPVPGLAGGQATLALVALRDVTENRKTRDTLRKTEQHLRASQKLEGLGRLAGGVAHDFRNMMQITMGYAHRLLKRPSSPADREDLLEIVRAGERATALTTQLLAFSRRQELRLRPLDLSEVITGMERLLQQTLGEDVHLLLDSPEGLPAIMADRAQIELVVVNIAMNARDAMPQGGELRVQLRAVEVGDAYASRLEVARGRYVQLEISDTGVGMGERTRQNVFEPFFTTKGAGSGTGLGLAAAYGIVRQCGGGIEVESVVGEGSTFRLCFPVAEGAVPERREQTHRVPTAAGGTGSVLLVEDEDGVRSLAALELRELGYTVFEAANGEDALRAASSSDDPIHLLVTDIVLPGMDGCQVFDAVAKGRPGVRVLFITAYAETHVLRGRIIDEGRPVLEKPFTAAQLAAAVRAALSS